jgi:hypothetical protein
LRASVAKVESAQGGREVMQKLVRRQALERRMKEMEATMQRKEEEKKVCHPVAAQRCCFVGGARLARVGRRRRWA